MRSIVCGVGIARACVRIVMVVIVVNYLHFIMCPCQVSTPRSCNVEMRVNEHGVTVGHPASQVQSSIFLLAVIEL